jgi:hypothetical protein
MKHAYPHHLSEEILRLWDTFLERETSEGYGTLPDHEVLEYLISTCYQVSMMSEELRSQRFRIALCDPSEFPPELGHRNQTRGALHHPRRSLSEESPRKTLQNWSARIGNRSGVTAHKG